LQYFSFFFFLITLTGEDSTEEGGEGVEREEIKRGLTQKREKGCGRLAHRKLTEKGCGIHKLEVKNESISLIRGDIKSPFYLHFMLLL
jgi:hypothetical protein